MSFLKFEKNNHIADITLNRPEAGNRINLEMAQDMADCCADINRNDDIHVVFITGSGNYFCAGSELDLLSSDTCKAAAAVAGLNCPVIAAINGDVIGVGLELALSCDMRFASNLAHFAMPQIINSQIPRDGGSQRLPRLIGKGRALDMILTGETIDAGQALKIGLVNRLFEPERLADEAAALVKNLAAKGPIALKYCKEAVNKGLDLTLEQGLRLEADLYFLIHTTEDRTEGIKSFLQKRPPEFKGK